MTWTWVSCFYMNMGECATSVRLFIPPPAGLGFSIRLKRGGITTLYRCDLLLPPRPALILHTYSRLSPLPQPAFVDSQDRKGYCHQATNTIPNFLTVLSDRPIQATLATATALQSNCAQSSRQHYHLRLSSHTDPSDHASEAN